MEVPLCLFYFICVFKSILTVEIINVVKTTTKECYGTHVGFGMSGNQDDHYESLRRRYKDCTHVEGNLEITHVDKAINSSYDINFLSSIEVVTGYVLLGLLEVDVIPLINLKLIRADSTYNILGEEYGLVVALTSEAGDDPLGVGLKELQMPALKEISKGKVFFAQNPHLCFVNTIDWSAIVPGRTDAIRLGEMAFNENCEKECDPECEIDGKRQCWGVSRFMCQRAHNTGCHPTCPGRCYDTYILGCCHPECAIGCYGRSDSDCEMCKYFQLGRRCVSSCPVDVTYRVGQECVVK